MDGEIQEFVYLDSDNMTIIINPLEEDIGFHKFMITLSDDYGNYLEYNFTVTVLPRYNQTNSTTVTTNLNYPAYFEWPLKMKISSIDENGIVVIVI